jgi:uncharacterized repeat protein (TIGR01451 family)
MELSRSLSIGAVICLTLSVALVVSVAQVPPTLNVDLFNDDASATACTDAPNNCSLRGAIITANARPGADTINLPAGLYTLSINGANEDAAATGDLDITDSLTIVGSGAAVTTIAWLDDSDVIPDRVFHIVSPGITVTISGIAIQNGQANLNGGGILNNATLTLVESVVSDNESFFGYGGGIFSGGAEGVASTLTLTNSTVKNNTAPDGGGIFNNGAAILTGSTVSANEALLGYGGYGGGILNGGVDAFDLDGGVFQSTLTLANSTVSGNQAASGGGIFNGESFGGYGGYGGFENTLTLTNSTVSDNTAPFGGGIGNAATLVLNQSTIRRNIAVEGGGIANIGIATLNNVTLSDNRANNGSGGGILNAINILTLNGSTVSNNTATNIGGGIGNVGARLDLVNSAVSDNIVNGSGGGIANTGLFITPPIPVGEDGSQKDSFGAVINLLDSTVNGNIAEDSGAGIANGLSGRALITEEEQILKASIERAFKVTVEEITFTTMTTAHLTNSTISTNEAHGNGGGVANSDGAMDLNNMTIADNVSDSDGVGGGDGGGVFNEIVSVGESDARQGPVNFRNTLIARNADKSGQGPDCFNSLTSRQFNIVQDPTGCSFDRTNNKTRENLNFNLALGPLADNGGPTLTHALLDGSSAIDAGNPAGCRDELGTLVKTDQRGVGRPPETDEEGVGEVCDSGAYERIAILVDLSITKADTPNPVNAGETLTYILTVTNNSLATATGVRVTDTLPADVSLEISVTPSQGNCVASCQLTCELGTISGGGSATVTIIVRPTRPGNLVNVATVSGAQFDPNPENNETQGVETIVTLPQPSTASREIPAVSDFSDPLLAYVLIGSPLRLTDPDPLTVLEPTLGRPGHDQDVWAMFRFNPVPAPGEYRKFSSRDPFFQFSQGRGAWLITRFGAKGENALTISGTPNDASRPFDIPLDPGLNQIATPFNFSPNFSLDWDGCVAPRLRELELPISSLLCGYPGESPQKPGYSIETEMKPMFGYWVFNRSSDSSTLSIPPECVRLAVASTCPSPVEQPTISIASPLKASFAAGWRMRLSVAAGEVKDVDNYLGVDIASVDEEDQLDYPEPPSVHGLSLSFPHPEWNASWPRYTTDIRGPSTDTHKVWDFAVRADMPDTTVKLFWRPRGGNTPLLTLYDVEGDQIVNMGQARVYTYDSGSGGVRHFQIIAEEK